MMSLVLFIFLAAAPLGSVVSVTRDDVVGTWTDTMCYPYRGRYEFRADSTFFANCEDEVDAGKWTFHPPGRIELVYYSDYMARAVSSKSEHHYLQIERFNRNFMYVHRDDGPKGALVRR